MVERIAAVVVTYESAAVLPGLLASLHAHEPGVRVVVVDNASASGPPDVGAHAELVSLPDNRGYGAACNVGWHHVADAGADIIAFLNPDVRVTGPSLTELARAMTARPDVGVATGPVVDADGRRVPSAWGDTSAARALWFAAEWEAPRTRALLGRVRSGGVATSGASVVADELDVDGHVVGGAMVVTAACIRELGGFDDGFFMFWEDADLCARACAVAWRVALLPCTPIVHVAGTSSAGVDDEQRWRWYLDGARRFASKHLSPARARRLEVALGLGRRLRWMSPGRR